MKFTQTRSIRCRQTTLALAVSLALVPALSHAAALEEVIVSARKTDENMQEVPTALTALTAQDLGDLKIQNFSQVGQTVPNLNIQNQFGSASAPQFYLRGVATGSLKFQTDAGVALYVDGVYLGRPAGTAFDLADVSRIEVLRGPQGSVFGRNSTGGAINMITAEPTGEFGGKAEAGFGNYGAKRAKVSLNLPEVAGLAARLTYLHNENDGFVKNESAARHTFNFPSPFGTKTSAKRFGMEKTDAMGLALSYTGIDKLKLDYRFDYTDKSATQMPAQLFGVTAQGQGVIGALGGDLGNVHAPAPSRQSTYGLDFSSPSKLRIAGHSLTADFEANDYLNIKNILAHRSLNENVGLNDIDGSAATYNGAPIELLASNQVRAQSQWSDELQFYGTVGSVDWIGGLFWFQEKGRDNNPVFIASLFPDGSSHDLSSGSSVFASPDYFVGANSTVQNKSRAAFAHATWHATDAFDLAAGLRYTKDDRHEHIIQAALITNQSSSASFHHTDWDVSATYKVNPDLNFYAKISTGYLTGGIISGVEFEPETIKSYEVGMKSQFLENRLRVNLSAFHTDREHLQSLQFNAGGNPSVPLGTYLADGGKSKQDGIELEITAVPVDGLTLTANYGHVNDHVDSGLRSLAPKNNAYLATQYEVATFSNGSHVDARIDGTWVDDHYQTNCPVGATADVKNGCVDIPSNDPGLAALDKAATSKASWQVGARVSLADIPLADKTKGRVSLWGKNLTNSDEVEFARDVGNVVIGTFQQPRTYGVDFSLDF